MRAGLDEATRRAVEDALAPVDARLERDYPGEDTSRQPVHTVYVPADRYRAGLAREWGAQARAAVEAVGGIEAVLDAAAVPAPLRAAVGERVLAKLDREPIEDLRIDLEDGYGDHGDAEDDVAVAAARALREELVTGVATPFAGIRFKSLEAATRARGLRTLDLFLAALLDGGDVPDGLQLTLPKVTAVEQVAAMASVCGALERAHGLPAGRLRFEVQVETPQAIVGPDGTAGVARMIRAGEGRVSALHYGTYDYSASLGIAAAYQSMEHPAADHAKAVMQVAAAGTGVRLSDGSTNVLPVGAPEQVRSAWALHARLVRRSLERGFYQGWDLHPAQLPTRFAATYAFYRQGLAEATGRLRNYLGRVEGAVLDEPATARALAWFLSRGLDCGAVDDAELDAAGVDPAALGDLLRRPGAVV
ncbi:DUF6986 family protein [Georgenia thermotolerans]|uniref:Aldolase n=1 Tax=Georgenia thermotolerans TaxID=527326 RepID=A0A7J5UJG4_9MICO|nr:aldolase/citrate lyase family protein [Georgenia thermotolerans]KAE8762456.1 aldolase [Georgenia thermotolerans]